MRNRKKKMEVDEAEPHEASSEIQSPKRKVIRVESQKKRKCQVPLVNHEEPFTGVTIDAMKMPSGTGR